MRADAEHPRCRSVLALAALALIGSVGDSGAARAAFIAQILSPTIHSSDSQTLIANIGAAAAVSFINPLVDSFETTSFTPGLTVSGVNRLLNAPANPDWSNTAWAGIGVVTFSRGAATMTLSQSRTLFGVGISGLAPGTTTLNTMALSINGGAEILFRDLIGSGNLQIAGNAMRSGYLVVQGTDGSRISSVRIREFAPDGEGVALDFLLASDFTPPALAGGVGEIAFGSVLVGSTVEQELSLANSGHGTLTVTIGGAQAPFTITPGPINVGVSAMVPASYAPTVRGADQSTLSVDGTNDSLPARIVTLTGQGVAPVLDVAPTADLDGDTVADVTTVMAEVGDALGAGRIVVQGRRGEVQRFGIRVENDGDGQLADADLGRLDVALGNAASPEFTGAGGSALLGDGQAEAFTFQFRARRNGTFSTTVDLVTSNGSPDGTNQGFSHEIVLEGTTEGQGAGIGGTIQFGTLVGGGVARCDASIRYQSNDDDQSCGTQIIQTDEVLPLDEPGTLYLRSLAVTAADPALASVFSVSGFQAGTLFDQEGDSLGVTISLDLWAARSWLLGQGITTGQVPISALLEITADDGLGGAPLIFAYDLFATLDAASIVPAPGALALLLGGLAAVRAGYPSPRGR